MGISAFGGTLSEGNLRFNGTSGNYHTNARSSIAVQSGKWYAEFYVGTASADSTSVGIIGVNSLNPPIDGSNLQQSNGSPSFTYESNGDKEVAPVKVTGNNNSTSTANWGTAYTSAGAIVGVAIDFDSASDGLIYFYLNGSLQTGTYMANNISLSHSWHFAIGAYNNDVWVANFGQDSSFAGLKTAQGNQDSGGIGDFYYTPPTGYKALCTSNLPAVAVIPSEHFNTVLYTGNGSTQSITGVGFQPDLLVGKARSDGNHTAVYDAVRGVQVEQNWSGYPADRAATNGVTAFGTDGFSVGSHDKFNRSGTSMVAWSWKANGSGSSNTEGSINTTATSANVDNGFSIISYSGNNTAGATIGHGLSKAPEMVIIKSRTNANDWWDTYHKDIGAANALHLNSTMASADRSYFHDTDPSSTLIYLGSDRSSNGPSETFIAYAFHSVDGYSKVGSWTGNNNADGPFIYTGFRPAWVLIKRTGSADSWTIYDNKRDTYNVTEHYLLPNTTNAENTYSTSILDFVSNGIKIRGVDDTLNNADSAPYIYIAFAETPFKYANAR
jgi:hypothetical protein